MRIPNISLIEDEERRNEAKGMLEEIMPEEFLK